MTELVFKVVVFENGSVEIRDKHDNPVQNLGNITLAKQRLVEILEAKRKELIYDNDPVEL